MIFDDIWVRFWNFIIFLNRNVVIKEKEDISDGIGTPSWLLAIYLFVAWVVIFLIIVRGVRSSGKASYFLALFPYLVLIILLVRACTLEGSIDGIIYFFKPQWGELLNPKVRVQKIFILIWNSISFIIKRQKLLINLIFLLKSHKHTHTPNLTVRYGIQRLHRHFSV